jgi:hypothetical protein
MSLKMPQYSDHDTNESSQIGGAGIRFNANVIGFNDGSQQNQQPNEGMQQK